MTVFRLLCKQITTATGRLSRQDLIDYIVKSNEVKRFSKTACPYCKQMKSLLESLSEPYFASQVDQQLDRLFVQNFLAKKTQQTRVPKVFSRGMHVEADSDVATRHRTGASGDVPEGTREKGTYDLVVIGGGSGGLAAANEAAELGRKVALCDYVKPSPRGTTWGLGGTCSNVGCVPKILMHRAATLGVDIGEAAPYGWSLPSDKIHDWETLVEEVQVFIKSTNIAARKKLVTNKVVYHNAFAEFESAHRIKVRTAKNEVSTVTAEKFIIAVGGRPRYLDIPGAREYAITSDDLFSMKYNPGKTVIVGSSFIALECAGVLSGLGMDVTVLARSKLLERLDQHMAEMVAKYMESHGVKFIRRCVPTSIENIGDGTPPLLKVHAAKRDGGDPFVIDCNTVLLATGRVPNTRNIGLENIGVTLNKSTGKIIVDEDERTSVQNIFAIGDVIDGKPELTPVAIKTGRLLSRRLYGGASTRMDYTLIPTTLFTPLEYGSVGLSEELAIAQYSNENIEVYHSHFNPQYQALTMKDESVPYMKVVCLKSEQDRIIGFHIFGPHAGEITQGFSLCLKLGAKLKDLQTLVGIHPTCAEIATYLSITKSSGKSVLRTFC